MYSNCVYFFASLVQDIGVPSHYFLVNLNHAFWTTDPVIQWGGPLEIEIVLRIQEVSLPYTVHGSPSYPTEAQHDPSGWAPVGAESILI